MNVEENKVVESELGDITVSKQAFERERSESDSWNHIKTEYGSEDIIDKLHFSKIESIKLQSEALYSPVIIETEEGGGKVFFCDLEKAEQFYKLLSYRRKAWMQNYQ